MIVAREKRRKNIAEYVLYMWQVEDTLRAMKFDMNLVEEKLIKQFKQPDSVLDEIRDWYANIILSMHEEGIMKSGHLNMVKAVISDMYDLHKRLISTHKDTQYLEKYKEAKPNIDAFHDKLKMDGINEIEVCFYGLYGLLLLRLKKKNITNETQKAMHTFSELLALLSRHFLEIEQGKTEI
jgi:hypothetical protein